LRGRVGDWAYYSCLLELREVARRVQFAQDLHTSKRLDQLIQRALTPNANRIGDYLVGQPQRFMSAIVVAVYGGEPRFHELAVRETLQTTPNALPELVEMSMGVLELRGDERLMAIDGQHRVRGVQLALEQRPNMSSEQITAIFVRHDQTAAGLQRTRRLFTTLNRYAKPVSKRDLVAQDEDDVVAIVVRELIDREPLLRERVSDGVGTSISPSDARNITTLPALYDAMDLVLRDRSPGSWSAYKRFRPAEAEIRPLVRLATTFWEELAARVETLGLLRRSPERSLTPSDRGPTGGHLLLRPVGLTSLAGATRILLNDGVDLHEAVRRLAGLPLDLAEPPWPMILWNPITNRMITVKENQRLATRWLAIAAGAGERGHVSIADVANEVRALDEANAAESIEILQRYRRAVGRRR